jgi:glucose/arabinose dehydrogenase
VKRFLLAARLGLPMLVVLLLYSVWPRAADLPLEQIKLPQGFSIALYAKVPNARSMTLGPDGVVFVGNRTGDSVYAVVDRDHDFRVDEVVKIAGGLNTPNGVAYKDGSLYVAELNRIVRIDRVADLLAKGARASAKPAVVKAGLPSDRLHGWKYLAFGPDGMLYFQIGAPCNICDNGDPYATIARIKADGTGFEIVARGVRNSVGLTWHPDTHDMWFTDNGRDNLGDDVPPDELNRAERPGLHFGYPYCHGGTIPDPEFGPRHPCTSYTAPAQALGPHVASLGLKFYLGTQFPASYRKQIFVAEHGSWNRSTPIGYRVSIVRLDGNRPVKYEPFAYGWLQGSRAWGRPVDILELSDGSLLVSDDTADAIYRITYKG